MSVQFLPLIYAPNEIFKKKALPVEQFDADLKNLVERMYTTLYLAHAVGMGANMVGVLKQIAIVDLQENGVKNPLTLINPTITYTSDEMQTFEERSLCFPGIDAQITRHKSIEVTYFDVEGKKHELKAEGFLSTVIQHEVDYLNGKVFLDYLSKMKRDVLIQKMIKHIRNYPPHIHTEHCNH